MEERQRQSGSTTYNFRKLVTLWLNSFTAFSIKPLRFATIVGIFMAVIGGIYGFYVVVRRILNPAMEIINLGWSSIIAILLFVGGMILFVLGLSGEYIGRIYMSVNDTPQYVIREIVDNSKE